MYRLFLMCFVLMLAISARCEILWRDLGTFHAFDTGFGTDILNGAIPPQTDTASNTLYFTFTVTPISDVYTERYLAGLQLFEGNTDHLGVGNAWFARGYSAFRTGEMRSMGNFAGEYDLYSIHFQDYYLPKSYKSWETNRIESPRNGVERTFVFRVKYVPGKNDLVTIWLNPNLSPGETEESQISGVISSFPANCSFDQIHLRHEGGGEGWTFSNIAIATSFEDFIAKPFERHKSPVFSLPPAQFRTWHGDQGISISPVRALAQDNDKFLWLGTDAGLVRFDGVLFKSFDLQEFLRNPTVRALVPDGHGSLWIGTAYNGIALWNQGYFKAITKQDGLPSDTISALALDKKERLWIGTPEGLALIQEERISIPKNVHHLQQRPISDIFVDSSNTVWIASPGAGVFHSSKDGFVRVDTPRHYRLLLQAQKLLVDKMNRLWVGAGDEAILCCDKDRWTRYRLPQRRLPATVKALVESPDGTVWAGLSNEGIIGFKDGHVLMMNTADGMADASVESLLTDSDGTLWTGTAMGISQLRPNRLGTVGINQGLGYGPVLSIAEVSDGILWAALPGDGIYAWSNGKFNRLKGNKFNEDLSHVSALLAAGDDTCWAACERQLLHFNPLNTNHLTYQTLSLGDQHPLALCKGIQPGTFWVGTQEGKVFQIRNETANLFPALSMPSAVTALLQDSKGSLWIGTDGAGLLYQSEGSFQYFSRSNGLSNDHIRTLWIDREGFVWIGTKGGLCCWNKEKLMAFTSKHGVPEYPISQILEDEVGCLWLGCDQGLIRIEKQGLKNLFSGNNTAIKLEVYGNADGMYSEQCSRGNFPNACQTTTGQLCFPTQNGIVVASSQSVSSNSSLQNVMFDEVFIDGEPQMPSNKRSSNKKPVCFNLHPGRHRLEIRYTVLGYDRPEQARFRHRLEGLESVWTEAGTRRIASYNLEEPGVYAFVVALVNGSDTRSKASVKFVIQPFFWQTRWFVSLVGISIIALVASLVQWLNLRQHRRQMAELEKQRELNKERTRIAQDLHDDLGVRLTEISLLGDVGQNHKEDPMVLSGSLQKVGDIAREAAQTIDGIVWALNPRNDTLQHLANYLVQFVEEFFHHSNIRCRLDVPVELPPIQLSTQQRHHLLLSVKEACNNVIRHSQASQVWLRLEFSQNELRITIEDNGAGFDPSLITGEHNGLRNQQQRMKAMGGRVEFSSVQNTSTRVILILPILQESTCP